MPIAPEQNRFEHNFGTWTGNELILPLSSPAQIQKFNENFPL